MLLLRWAILVSLLLAVAAFVAYALTGQTRFKRAGLMILIWTLVAAFGFFAVLVVERLA